MRKFPQRVEKSDIFYSSINPILEALSVMGEAFFASGSSLNRQLIAHELAASPYDVQRLFPYLDTAKKAFEPFIYGKGYGKRTWPYSYETPTLSHYDKPLIACDILHASNNLP